MSRALHPALPWMFALAAWLPGCTFDFSPYEAVYACDRNEDCADGWVCVAAGASSVCARPVDAPDAPDVAPSDVPDEATDTAVDVPAEVEAPDAPAPGDRYLVVTDVTYQEAGDGVIERIDGAKPLRYFIGPEPLGFDEAGRYCETLTVGGHLWRLARATQLGALSQCCLTRPGIERCAGTTSCYDPDRCLPYDRCLGCGAPPEGWACWWHPTFDRSCGVFWAAIDGDCASAFDFTNSERVNLDDGALAGVLCISSSE